MTSSSLAVLPAPPSLLGFLPDRQALRRLARATLSGIDALGLLLLEWSFEPIGFSVGVFFLQLHHQLHGSGLAAEIGR